MMLYEMLYSFGRGLRRVSNLLTTFLQQEAKKVATKLLTRVSKSAYNLLQSEAKKLQANY